MTSKNFNIKETVHKNIEQNQFPSFSNHRSMVGWCSMNYPKVLVNPIYLQKEQVSAEKKFELQTLFQMKNPVERKHNDFTKPFSNYVNIKEDEGKQARQDRQEKQEKQRQRAGYKGDTGVSSFTLCTTKHQTKAQIFEENNRKAAQYSAVLPLSNLLGADRDGKYDRKIRKIGQIYYNPPNEGEQMRHLKKLPNTIIDEQNLLQILNEKLQYLDISYKMDISNDLINKFGYLAPNLKSLNLTAVPITSAVLVELGKYQKITQIDISLCKQLEEDAILSFLKDTKNLIKFNANHLVNSMTDACMQLLGKHKKLKILNVNFCQEITSMGLDFVSQTHQFEELGLSSLPNVKGETLSKIFVTCVNMLKSINLSFNNSKQLNNALMQKLGMCLKLETIILTGCEMVSDQGINNLIFGEKGKNKQPQGFAGLQTLKIGGLMNVSDQIFQLIKRCPKLKFVEANNLDRLSDHLLEQIKNHPSLNTLLINFTPSITDQKIKDIKQANPKLNIIRNISKMTDPADDGLRMPIPPASMKMKKPKKKKKK